MKRSFQVALVLCLALAAGCSTPGRVTGIEWDFRDPAQIQAATATDAVVYQSDTKTAEVQARTFTAWSELFDMVTKLRMRLTVVKVEWGRPAASASEHVAPVPGG